MAGAYLGGRVAHLIPASVLLIFFALMILITASVMLRGRRQATQPKAEARGLTITKVVSQGLGVGVVTGLIGAGGGFLVVPALALLGGMPMATAVGTSLVVIALNSFAGLAGYLGHVAVDWPLAGVISASAVIGSIAGSHLAGTLEPQRLRQGFA